MKSGPLKIGIACFPLIGGSGILATALGSELARRGHEVYFFSYAQRRLGGNEDCPVAGPA